MRLVHDTKYPGAACQPSYMLRHSLITILIAILQRGIDQLASSIGLGEVLHDSFGLDGNSQASSPAIIIGDQTHFRNLFIRAPSKTVYYDPMPHTFPVEVLQAFQTYHLLYDSEHTWQYVVISCAVQFDYYSCGIWAMWMAENWLQFTSELHQQPDFRQWVLPCLSTPPIYCCSVKIQLLCPDGQSPTPTRTFTTAHATARCSANGSSCSSLYCASCCKAAY